MVHNGEVPTKVRIMNMAFDDGALSEDSKCSD